METLSIATDQMPPTPPAATEAAEPQPRSRAAAKAQELATSQLNAQKDKVAEALESVGLVMQQGSQSLQQQGQPQLGAYARTGAQKVQELSGYLRQTDGGELLQKVREAARQQPALVAGGAFLVAVIGARVMKSLQSQPEEQNSQPGAAESEPRPEAAQSGATDTPEEPARARRSRRQSPAVPQETAD